VSQRLILLSSRVFSLTEIDMLTVDSFVYDPTLDELQAISLPPSDIVETVDTLHSSLVTH